MLLEKRKIFEVFKKRIEYNEKIHCFSLIKLTINKYACIKRVKKTVSNILFIFYTQILYLVIYFISLILIYIYMYF